MQAMLNNLLPDQSLPAITITGMQYDSRKVKAGDLFFATRGVETDGRKYVSDVINVAAAVLCEAPYDSKFANDFEVANLSFRKGEVASRFYGVPSSDLNVIAVTGTNGKTSISHYLAQALTALGQLCGVVGTLGAGIGDNLAEIGMTTPDAIDLQRWLFIMKGQGATAASVEASSHGLVQGRLNGTKINLAIFTNISRDHLDYHKDFDTYAAAKKKLFTWPALKNAVVNLDDELGEALALDLNQAPSIDASSKENLAADPKWVKCMTYSLYRPEADVHCTSILYNEVGISALVAYRGKVLPFRSSLLGEFNVSNLLAVIATLLSQGEEFSRALSVVSQLRNVKGRMDVLSRVGKPTVVIDYAHTPDALKNALLAIKQHARGRVICVMGCGGDRDRGKRPLMGEISGRLANQTIVTSDNPRTEEPHAIIDDIVCGFDAQAVVSIEVDRTIAIEKALKEAGLDDLVLIAGKGHEEYQDVNGQKLPYSDYRVVENYLSED